MSEYQSLDNVLALKVGTSTMFRINDGREVLDHDSIATIGAQVMALREQGWHVPIISSGAVSAGMEATGITIRPSENEAMPELQRLAGIGWTNVVQAWRTALPGATVGSMLVTKQEVDLDSSESNDVVRTTYTHLGHGDVLVFNNNDGVAHTELAHQAHDQNDTLAAIIAALLARSRLFGDHIRLVLLTDVDGVYEDPSDAETIIREITIAEDFEYLAGGPKSNSSKGGMKSKFRAAQIAGSAGVEMWIANGREENAIQRALKGEIGTHFERQLVD